MTAIHFDLPAAQDALARSDDGVKALPGDRTLLDAYEGYLQQEWGRFEEQQDAAERAVWLARQCPGCVDGGTGEECDEHHEDRIAEHVYFGLVAE